MRARGSIRLSVAAALTAALLSPTIGGGEPAAAHTGYTSIADDSAADRVVTGINGTTVTARILRPSTDALRPTNGWPLVVYMAGDMKNRCANMNEKGSRTSWYTRKEMAEHGFAVLSFNARGRPSISNSGENPSGALGCDTLDDAEDAVEKTPGVAETTGWDLGGPLDRQDIDDLIEWAVTTYASTGCTSPCIDGNKVGIVGYGMDALKALHMAVPAATNPQFNSRVKGVVAIGYGENAVRNVKDMSSDGSSWRDLDLGLRVWVPDANGGTLGVADPGVYKHTSELLASKYLNTTVPAATTTWFDERTLLDDNATVDRVGDITMPVFMANAFLDNDVGITTATLAYNKLSSANKYLYLGPCGSTYGQLADTDLGPCRTNNKAALRDRVHAFLDRWVRVDTSTTVGGPVWWAVPPATNPFSTDSWSVATDAIAAWPPSTNALDAYTATYCLDGAGEWLDGACSAVLNGPGTGLQDTGNRTMSNVIAQPGASFCFGSTYDSSETASYTSGAANADYRMLGFEADVWLSSNTTRLQVYADLFAVTPGSPETETRIWQGSAQALPVVRNGTAGTLYRFKFRPGGNAWTLKTGDKLRLKLTANYKKGFAQELLPATYTIRHTDTNPFTFKITYDL
ncbi:MAG TPA: CocE/NonD family hydrolase [Acidimicrobiales bacterium]|nr:CocE/NonD family hydrolase [Acidimicrobiales bacterium]